MKNKMRNVTYRQLTIYEENVLLPILISGLEMKKEKMNAVTIKQIVNGIKSQGLKINSTSVERIMHHIRTNDLIKGLMASSNGYYVTNCEQEMIAYENSLLGRESAIKKVRMSIKRQRRTMFSQPDRQTQLF